jgi:hypothetical protein
MGYRPILLLGTATCAVALPMLVAGLFMPAGNAAAPIGIAMGLVGVFGIQSGQTLRELFERVKRLEHLVAERGDGVGTSGLNGGR